MNQVRGIGGPLEAGAGQYVRRGAGAAVARRVNGSPARHEHRWGRLDADVVLNVTFLLLLPVIFSAYFL